MKNFLSYLKPHRFLLIISFLFCFISVAFSLIIPIFIGKAIDEMIGPNQVDFANIYPILLWILIFLTLSAVFSYFYEWIAAKLTQSVVKKLRDDAFYHLEYSSVVFIDTHAHGDLVSRIVSDIEQISNGLLEGFKQLYKGVITILITLIFMFFVNYILAFVVILITPLSLFVASYINKRNHRFFTKQAKIQGEIGAYVLEMIENQKIVKGLTYENQAIAQFKQQNQELYQVGCDAQFSSSLTNPSTRFVNNLVYTAVGIIGMLLMLQNASFIPLLTIGGLSSFLTYANQYTKPFNEISGVVTELQTALSSLKRVQELLHVQKEVDDGNQMIHHPIETIHFDHIYFSYDPNRPLIHDFHFTVKKGQKIAIVGPTGCGKTTMINLLMRFYDVNHGGIFINNQNIIQIPKADLRKSFGMVLQDTWIFHGTVFENVAYGKTNATKEEVIEACKKVHAHSFISRLPKGYDTIISATSGLSTGEKQLLTIARMMLRQPEIIILDEATSNIDTRTEKKINDAFDQMMQGKTIFVIAHRLSTIQSADQILVMKDGNIIEKGTHQQLLKQNGFYKKLYLSQFEHQELI